MRLADIAVAVILAVVFAAVFGAFFDFAPLLAKAMVRRAALWWHSDLDSAEKLAEKWQALVEERPIGTLKVVTALGFLAKATVRHGKYASRPLREQAGQLLRGWAGLKQRALGRLAGVLRSTWSRGSRARPWEVLAITGFLVGAALGQWVGILLAGLVACTSRLHPGQDLLQRA